MSTFGGPPKTPAHGQTQDQRVQQQQQAQQQVQPQAQQTPFPNYVSASPQASTSPVNTQEPSAAPPAAGRQRAISRPASMIGGYVPPMMDTQDTIPELLPIFTVLNSHSNKLYQEGYFLKLHDLDTREC